MAKREKRQRTAKMTRRYRSRVEQEQRQVRYILIGVGLVAAVSILVLLFGLYQTQVANPAATRRAKDALKVAPAATVDGTMISIADWQSRVRYERQLRINQISQINQQMSLLDSSSELGQQLISQGQTQIQELQNMLELGDLLAEQVLQQMIEEQLIRQEATRRGITVTPKELQEYIEVAIFYYPYPPTPEPFPTLPAPTPPPTATVTPEPTLIPTPSPTARSLEDFQADYAEYTRQIKEITEMSEEAWRSMVESQLYGQKLLEVFASDVETEVQQIQGSYISTQDQETAEAYLARLEAGETFEALVEEIRADESEQPLALAGFFGWSPFEAISDRFGEAFAQITFDVDAGQYAPEIIPVTGERFYLAFVEGNEVRELASYLVEQQQREAFDGWLEQAKQNAEVVYGDWASYVPTEPSL